MGIEPTLVAWEATVLPLNYTRTGPGFYAVAVGSANAEPAVPRTAWTAPFASLRSAPPV